VASSSAYVQEVSTSRSVCKQRDGLFSHEGLSLAHSWYFWSRKRGPVADAVSNLAVSLERSMIRIRNAEEMVMTIVGGLVSTISESYIGRIYWTLVGLASIVAGVAAPGRLST
jgi:hypothetical protein